jgi:hypothetical protein
MVFRLEAILPVLTQLAIFSSMASTIVNENAKLDDNLVAAGFPISENYCPSFVLASRGLHVAVFSLDQQWVQRKGNA